MAPPPLHRDGPLLRQLLRRPHQVLPVLVVAPLVQAAPLARLRRQQQQHDAPPKHRLSHQHDNPQEHPDTATAAASASAHKQERWRSQSLGWHTAAIGAVGFAAVSADVFGSPLFESAHLLAQLDALGHAAAQGIDPTLRFWVMDKAVSDTFITTGLIGWAALTLHLALHPKAEASTPAAVMGLAWAFYGLFAGRVDGDPWLIGSLKEAFHRARPSTLHRSMSFPSGHTTSATFLVASLLFVLLPVLLHNMKSKTSGKTYEALERIEASWPLLGVAWLTTATGRVLGDAHWFSDTLAAGFLSLGLASVLAMATEALIRVMDCEASDEAAELQPMLEEVHSAADEQKEGKP